MSEDSLELLREKLNALVGVQLSDAEVMRLLLEFVNAGGGVTLELDEVRVRLIRREGRFVLKKEERRSGSSLPPRATR